MAWVYTESVSGGTYGVGRSPVDVTSITVMAKNVPSMRRTIQPAIPGYRWSSATSYGERRA